MKNRDFTGFYKQVFLRGLGNVKDRFERDYS